MIKATYGYSVDYESDPLVNLANKAMHEFSLAVEGGAWAVDSLPICSYQITPDQFSTDILCIVVRWIPAWVPGAGFQSSARQFKNTVTDFLTVPVDFVRDQMVCLSAVEGLFLF